MLENLTLLFVEDQEEERKAFEALFAPIVKALYLAKDGEDGLELFQSIQPDIVMTDLNMPIMDGITLCKKIKSIEERDSYIIALTASHEPELMQEAINARFDAYLLKPIHKKPIIEALQSGYKKIRLDQELRIQMEENELQKSKIAALEDLKNQNRALRDQVRAMINELLLKDQMLMQKSKQAALGELTLMIAHQWNQPLNALNAVMQNIIQVCQRHNEKELDFYFSQGRELLAEMSQTILDFKEFFKTNKPVQHLNLSETIPQILNMVLPLYAKEKISLSIESAKDLIIVGPPSELGQCLLSLLQNSKEAIMENNPKERWIKIETASEKEHIRIDVEDSGGGADETLLEKIFDPYFTTKEEGVGIGLYLVRAIVEKSFKGHVLAQNRTSGLCISLYLPYPQEKHL